MADHGSTPPSESGDAKQDSEEATIEKSSSAIDMLALGFGMLEIAPLEDKTRKQNEVSVIRVVFWSDSRVHLIRYERDLLKEFSNLTFHFSP